MSKSLSVSRYDVFVDLDFDGLKYSGHEKIELSTGGDVELDCVGLTVRDVKADGRGIKWSHKGDKLYVGCGEFKGALEVEFEGNIPADSVVGIYAAPYEGGRVVTTQFEAIHARRFIPCFDTPQYKSKFRLTVRVREGLKVISNTPIEKLESSGGYVTHYFQETPPIPTYLLYLGVGEFLEHTDGGTPPIILAFVRGREAKTSYPLRVGRMALKYFNEYFGVDYPLPKLHLIAVPTSGVGGMENWGAITFGEAFLLASEDSPVSQRLTVSDVVAHEIAHQWFGDLVTMKWWDDLWLNESFATIMSYKALERLFPEWDAQAVFVADEMSGGLFQDSLSTTHPIQARVAEAHEIEQLFDAISYNKGASVLRMIEAYMGGEQFRRGVHLYLTRHAYGSAVGSDFWGALSEASGKDVGALAEEWIRNPGYPLVEVGVEGGRLRLSQERFTLTHTTPRDRLYPVPLTLEVNGKPTTHLLRGREETLEFPEGVATVKLNLNRSGFYRVHYSSLEVLPKLNNIEWGGLLDDYFNMVLAGRVGFEEYERALDRALADRENYLPVWMASDQLWRLFIVRPAKYGELARRRHLELLRVWLGVGGDMAELTRTTLSERLARLDEGYALALASTHRDAGRAPPALRQAVIYAQARIDGDLEALFKKYKESVDPEEKARYLRGLAAIESEDAFNTLMEYAWRGELKGSDFMRLVGAVASNPAQRRALVKALRSSYEKFEEFSQRLSGYSWAMARGLVGPLSVEGASNPSAVEEILRRMERKETERPVREIRELIQAYSRI